MNKWSSSTASLEKKEKRFYYLLRTGHYSFATGTTSEILISLSEPEAVLIGLALREQFIGAVASAICYRVF